MKESKKENRKFYFHFMVIKRVWPEVSGFSKQAFSFFKNGFEKDGNIFGKDRKKDPEKR